MQKCRSVWLSSVGRMWEKLFAQLSRGKGTFYVSSMAGTTRDAIDTDIDMPDGRRFKLIDTAGVRKRASIASGKDGAEPLSVERAFHAVRRAEVAVLVIDASEGVTQQDFRLSEYVAAEGRACVVVVNKWDKIPARPTIPCQISRRTCGPSFAPWNGQILFLHLL
jgi:small GTP-binding protein